MSMMSEAYREVLRKQKVWLPGLIPTWVQEFKFQVMDLDTLANKDGHSNANKPWAGRILLLDHEGEIIGIVGYRWVKYYYGRAGRFLSKLFGGDGTFIAPDYYEETVEEALERLRPASAATQYILVIRTRTVLYRMSSGRSIDIQIGVKKEEEATRFKEFLS